MKKIDVLNCFLITSLVLILFYGSNWDIVSLDYTVPLYWYINISLFVIIPMVIGLMIFKNHRRKIFSIAMIVMFVLPLLWIFSIPIMSGIIYEHTNVDNYNGLSKQINLTIFILILVFALFKYNIMYKISCIFTYSMIGTNLLTILLNSFNFTSYESQIKLENPATFNNKVNVYHLLFDGYTSNYSIKKYEGFDNSPIYRYLENNGFKTYENARSNYFKTFISMTSLFEMEYQNLDDINIHTYRLKSHKEKLISFCNNVSKTFYHNNYLIYNKENEPFNICGMDNKNYAIKESDISFFSTFINSGMPKRFIAKHFSNLPKTQKSDDSTNQKLNHILKGKNDFKYVYIHNANTVFTPSCFENPNKEIITRQKYKCFVKTVNSDIKKSVDLIQQNDPNALIIISADHGSVWRHKPNGETRVLWFDRRDEIFSIMLAVKYPKKCKSFNAVNVENISPVNIYRYVFACLQGKKPSDVKPLPYKAYLKGTLVDRKIKTNWEFDWQYFKDNFSD